MTSRLASRLLLAFCVSQTCASALLAQGAELDAGQQERLRAIAQEIDQAADLRAIKRLEHRYAQYLSAGHWREAAALFSEAGLLVAGEQRVEGREAIGTWLRQQGAALQEQGLAEGRLYETFVLSNVLNLGPEPGQALGRWREILWEGDYGEKASWAVGINENRYVEERGEWRFAERHHYPLFGGEYQDGWHMLKEEASTADVTPVPFHYSVDEAGIPALLGATAEMPMATLSELEAQAARLLDEDAVINLQNAYGYYLDRMMWDDLADLFHEQGSLALGQAGSYQGRDSIRRALEQFGPGPLPVDEVFDHVQLQPVVTVAPSGERAQARGHELRMLGRHQGESFIGSAVFVNDYVKIDGSWRLDKVRVFERVLSDYQQGWARSALPAATAPEGFPVDTASSENHPAYPAFAAPGLDLLAETGATLKTTPMAMRDGEGDVDQRLAALATKASRLDAYIGSENVANAYGYSIDEFLWDMMADLFSEDGWKELSYIGRYTGRERVRQSVVDRYGRNGRRPNSMTFHQKTQPVITVSEDGGSAKIRTRLFQMNAAREPGGSWMSGIYENTAVKENGVWKLSSMDLDYTWSADLLGGWARVEPGSFNRFVPAPGSLSGSAAPDAPLRGIVTPPYPEAPVDMAFHYRNPVSGREPPLLLSAP